MKGKNPTRVQRKILQGLKYNPSDWLVLKNPSDKLIIQHRTTKDIETIPLV